MSQAGTALRHAGAEVSLIGLPPRQSAFLDTQVHRIAFSLTILAQHQTFRVSQPLRQYHEEGEQYGCL